jgi:hypothetical protein
MLELEPRRKHWDDGFVEIDFAYEDEVRTARMERNGGEPAFADGTPKEWATALERWCDENEQLLDSWQQRLRGG